VDHPPGSIICSVWEGQLQRGRYEEDEESCIYRHAPRRLDNYKVRLGTIVVSTVDEDDVTPTTRFSYWRRPCTQNTYVYYSLQVDTRLEL
jgi:hypothetical protein